MLLGCDISKWNKDNVDCNVGEFTLIKVTEGVTYQDPVSAEYVKNIDDEQLIGAYHFLRADNEKKGNTPEKEATNFVNTLNKLGLLYKAVLVCDYEAGSLGKTDYLLKFLEAVYKMTGVKCLIYCSSSATKAIKNVYDKGYKLWVANYNVAKPTIYNWKEATIWQLTSKPFDIDIFYGSRKDWYRLANKA